VLCSLLEITVAEYLEIDQADTNHPEPHEQQAAQKIKAVISGRDLARWQCAIPLSGTERQALST
jgi:hypothetical protein